MDGPKIARLYYSTRDVCELLKIPAHTLRSWERRFALLKPVKRSSGKRLFKPHDLEIVMLIKKMKDEGCSDREVSMFLSGSEYTEVNEPSAFHKDEKSLTEFIHTLRQQLNEILNIIDE